MDIDRTDRSKLGPTRGAVRELAFRLLGAGLSVMPIRLDASKAPACKEWKPLQKLAMTPEQAEQAWRQPAGIAVITGAVSGGLEALDFDADAETVFPLWRELVESEVPGLIAKCSIVRTPGNGFHVRFRSWHPEGNLKLAMPASGRGRPLIETRGEGGYVLVEGNPPQAHLSGGSYEHIEGPPLGELEPISREEREILIRCARGLDQEQSPDGADDKSPVARPVPIAPGARPGDAFNAKVLPADLLAERSWVKVRELQDKCYWRRPGKESGWSATTGLLSKSGRPLARIFSTSAGIPVGTYDAFALYAAFEFDGNLSKAAAHLKNQEAAGSLEADESSEPPDASEAPDDSLDNKEKPSGKRTQILVDLSEKDNNDVIISALGSHSGLYQRGGALMTAVRASAPTSLKDVLRPEGTPMILNVSPPRLREMMTEVADFWAVRTVGRARKPVRVPPPGLAAAQILARHQWDGVRHLEGVIETPSFLLDGRILNKHGWDEASGLLYVPSGEFLSVADKPTRADAVRSASALLELVQDFPFAAMHHRAAWLAALLTAFARFGFKGPTPLFLYDANTAGAGKSLLCDIIAVLATGRPMSRVAWPDDDNEVRKTLLSLAVADDRFCLWDNIGEGCLLGGPALDNALTAEHYKGRLLGTTQMVDVPFHLQQFATGNNVILGGDTERRTLHSRLVSPHEKPEERSDFRRPRLRAFLHEHRPTLVQHVLTILKAFHVAGRPIETSLVPFGSYEGWSDLIRGAVIWATEGSDPCAGKDELKKANINKAFFPSLAEGWEALPGGRNGLTAADALKLLNESQEFATLREVLVANLRKGELNTRSLGAMLRDNRDRVASGRKLVHSGEYQGAALWKIERIA